MTRPVILRTRAERDIQATFEWYESQQSGLGEEFLAHLREKLEALRSFPELKECCYQAPPIKRVWIPKDGQEQHPLASPRLRTGVFKGRW